MWLEKNDPSYSKSSNNNGSTQTAWCPALLDMTF
jgi:hypothetical protein